MENLKGMVFRPIINLIPFSLIKRSGLGKLIIMYYHIVHDNEAPHIKHLYKYKNNSAFCDDLEFLLNHYTPIGLMDVINWTKCQSSLLPQNCFLLTFDDGLREIYDNIAPILLEKGITATFFISSAFLDNRELCYLHKASLLVEKICKGISPAIEEEIKGILLKKGISFSKLSEGLLKVDYSQRAVLNKIADALQVDFQGYLNEKQPYLTSSQVNKLIDQGFTIGAHSIDHPYYSGLSLTEQLEQTIMSVKEIRGKFNLDYGAFAFPHNDSGVSPEFFNKLQESGLIDVTFGTGGLFDRGLCNHRQRISLEKPVLPAREIIAWQYMRRLYKKMTWNFGRMNNC